MKNKSGNTAFGAGAVRLMEQYVPEGKRLFNDDVIAHLTNPVLRFMLKFRSVRNYFIRLTDKSVSGIIGGQICRTKYIDDKTLEVLDKVEQIVILGAGLDTRAYRLKGMENKTVYEIDLPSVQKIKKNNLKKYFGKLPSNVTFIPIDFNKDTLEDSLHSASFDYTKTTLVIFEAVTQYITPDAVDKVFKFLAKLWEGSFLIFTYILKDFIERKTENAVRLMDWAEKKNCPFIFGIDPSMIHSFLQKYSLEMMGDVGTEFYQENYLEPIDREIVVSEGERISFSRVVK